MLSPRRKLLLGFFKYGDVRERGQKRRIKLQKGEGCEFSVLKQSIFTFSRELESAVAMLFRLIKENEIWVKSHGSYLQIYTTCADGIAQTCGVKPKEI
jgi:hypothetical protein